MLQLWLGSLISLVSTVLCLLRKHIELQAELASGSQTETPYCEVRGRM